MYSPSKLDGLVFTEFQHGQINCLVVLIVHHNLVKFYTQNYQTFLNQFVLQFLRGGNI